VSSEADDKTALTSIRPEGAAPQKKKRPPTGRFEARLGFLLGLAGLAASRLGQLWIAFDVFAQFTAQFAVVTVAFLVAMFMPRAKLLAAFLLIVVGLAGIGAWPYAASQNPTMLGEPRTGEIALRVASFNTLWVNEDIAAIRAEVLRLDADMVALIEMGPSKRRLLAELKDRYPYQADCYGIDYCNLVLFSKLPIVDSEGRTNWDGPPILRASLGPEAGGLTVVVAHTIRFPHSRAQFRQIVALTKYLEGLPNLQLVMGDFNATPYSRIIQEFVQRSGLSRLTGLPSWPAHARLPQLGIDHIFASPRIRQLESQKIGEPAGSDHYPVTLRLAVPLGFGN
jgi:endonuclease/exonuclease/phosphatase (EEP) superfamily protein YafD